VPEYDQQISFPERELHAGKFAFLGVLTLIGLILACITLNALVTRPYWAPYMGALSDRLAAIESHREAIDSVFIGSSRVGSAINPVLLDELNAGAGFESTSFNLSLTNNSYAGASFLLDKLGEISLPNLRYVLIEPGIALIPNMGFVTNRMSNVYSSRVRYIFDYTRSNKSIAIARGNGDPLRRKFSNIGGLIYVFGIHMSNLGVAHDIYTDSAIARGQSTDFWPSRGYLTPNDVSTLPPGMPTAANLDGGYCQLNEVEVEALAELINKIHELGAEPIFFFPPSLAGIGLQRALREAALAYFPDIEIIEFVYDNEQQHHPIYDNRKYWVDRNHLSETGNRYFTDFLSESWRKLSAEPAPKDHVVR